MAGLLEIIGPTDRVEVLGEKPIEATGESDEDLFIAWLREVLFVTQTSGWMFRRAEIDALEADRVRGRLLGEPYDEARHQIDTEVKAVTYHALQVVQTADGWEATVVFDL